MTIAVHIALTDPQNDTGSDFNYNCFIVLAARFPEHHFIFIFDKAFHPSIITEKNITPVLLGPQIKNRLLQHYFYNFKIPRLLNKYNVDFFVSADTCSLRTNVPQYLLINDLSFLKKKNLFSKTDIRYFKRYTGFFVRKAAILGVMNPYLKKILHKTYTVADDKINILKMGIDPVFKPCSYDQAEKTRSNFTEGKEYFLFFATAASCTNILVVLKAFSLFKKWQKSGMQLVILFSPSVKENTVKELSSYKYRADVKIATFENQETTAAIIASAYTAIHLPETETTETEGLKSMASGVSLIAIDNDFYKSIYKEGSLYSAIEEKEISEQMMLLYKDENKRNNLITVGKTIAAEHEWQNAAGLLWQTIQPDSATTHTFAKK